MKLSGEIDSIASNLRFQAQEVSELQGRTEDLEEAVQVQDELFGEIMKIAGSLFKERGLLRGATARYYAVQLQRILSERPNLKEDW